MKRLKRLPLLGLVVFFLGAEGSARAGDRARVALLAKITTPKGTSASFGRDGAAAGPIIRAMLEHIDALGFEHLSTSDFAPTLGSPPQGLPVDDRVATELAAKVGAGIVIVAGIRAESSGRVRGTQLHGAKARLRLRILDVSTGQRVFEGDSAEGGYAASSGPAAESAVLGALGQVREPMARTLERHWPAPVARRGVDVVVSGAMRWGSVSAVLQRLAATRGVEAVHLMAARLAQVVLSVEHVGDPAELVASMRRTRLSTGVLSARQTARGVEVKVRGDASGVIQVE